MSDPQQLTFMMGEFQSLYPTERLYVKNHMWALPLEKNRFRFGLTAYAVRLLQDVYFLDWTVEPGTRLTEKQEFGQIESQKAEASLYAPVAGKLTQLNAQLIQNPAAINVDKYGDGWLFEMQTENPPFLTPTEYISHLKAVWKVTQQTIKGQLS